MPMRMACQWATARAAALLLLVLLMAAAMQPVAAAKRHKHKLRLEDIVIAYPADTRHLEVARASRAWRKGIMRTFIANNVPPPEDVRVCWPLACFSCCSHSCWDLGRPWARSRARVAHAC